MATPKTFWVEHGDAVLVGDRWGSLEPSAPAVVLLHAAVCDRRSWQEIAPRLRELATVVTYDRRGFGETATPAGDFSHLADLWAVLDATTDGPVWLVGTSMGGGLALDAALTAPERVAGLVLLGPGVSGAPEPEQLDPATRELSVVMDRAEEAGDLDLVNEVEVRVRLDGPAAPPGRVGGPARDLALAMHAAVLRRGGPQDAGASGIDAWTRLEEVAVPTTVACGDLDVPALLGQAQMVLQRIPGARWADMTGTAHLPYLERPELVAAVVTAAVRASA